jgi:proteasome lid subunit RPN8/RPN11
MVFELPPAMYEEILAHARAGMPHEACGVVAGENGSPVRVYPMRNAEQSPVVYRFDEREQLEVFNEIEEKGWDLLAFFHSHTHTEAWPSPTDVRQAMEPGWLYVIVSLKDGDPVLRSFRITDGKIQETPVVLES